MNSKKQAGHAARPLASYHPDIWGDRFLVCNIPGSCHEAEQDVEKLKEEVKRELLKEASNDVVRQMRMIDAIQRLGIEYHFEHEIDQALQDLSEKLDHFCKDQSLDLCSIALCFRLLRQHGYSVSCGIFDKFLFEGVVKSKDVAGVLELFEATHLRIHGEDTLDDAYEVTRNYLISVLPSLGDDDHVARQVHRALYEYPIRRGLPRVEARHYISIYEQCASHHQALLKLAKLDFNLLQSMHKRELSQLCRWWKDLEVRTKLSYARDRLVETYFWILGVYFEPKYSIARKILTKVQALASLFDDTFDAYATFEELQLFTDAIERWSYSCLDQLPDYMKIIYKAVLQVFEEIEEEMMKQGTFDRLSYGVEAMKVIVRDYFAEVKWREEKYKPTTEEYVHVATRSCAYTSLIIISFLALGDIVSTQHLDWVLSRPDPVKAALIISRLSDDIGGHEFERKREHIPSVVECYTEEHKVSKEEAIIEFNNQREAAWKVLNQAFLRPTSIPAPLLHRIFNYVRVIVVIYSKGDWYTHVGPEMQSLITQLFIDLVP